MAACPAGTSPYTIKTGDTLWMLAQRHNTTVNAIMAANPGLNPDKLVAGQVICLDPGSCISAAELALSNEMRMLWEQHVAWTRMTIISIAHNLPDLDLVTRRLLRNPADFEVLFRRYYGAEKAARFASLLKEHLVIAAQLVKAAKAGNTREAAELEKKWYANADEIAAFLSSINPNWPRQALETMLHEHLALTKDEAVARLSKNYAADIALYDRIEKQILGMADALTSGIVKQFPEKFV